ncbi:MAG: SDR family oxidoreductase [Chloroflexi bacterium]|nr:SDR family oxidoreductase [Chloroflexota bacterium]
MANNEFALAGRKALVTGGPRGYTQAIVRALAEAGADVAVACHRLAEARQAAAQAKAAGRNGVAIKADVRSDRGVSALASEAVRALGQVDILVNDATVEIAVPVADLNPAEWDQALAWGLTAPFLCSRALGAAMAARGDGKIINLISGLADRGIPNGAALCAVESGVAGLTRALAMEWARHNVQVNAVATGWMESEPIARSPGEAVTRYIPMRRLGKPEDLAGLIVYLASPLSGYLTGQVLHVDGGVGAHL